MAKERNLVFDALKVFAMFLVLWGHCVQHLLSSDETTEPMYLLIYSFHMPLFMTLVGYFSGSVMKLTFKELVVKKGRQLIVPTLTVGVAYLLVGWVDGDFAGGLDDYVRKLWFTKCAFLCFILYYVSVKLCRSLTVGIVVSLMFTLVYSRYNLVWMYPCFVFGVIINRNYQRIKSKSWLLTIVSGIVFVTMLCFWDGDFWVDRYKSDVVKSLPDLTLLWDWMYWYLFKVVIGLVGTMFFITLFESLSNKIRLTKTGRMVCGWGKETLGIYLFQTVILEIIMARLLNFDELGFAVFNFVVAPVLSLGVMLVCLWLIGLTKKSRWLSLLLLGLPLGDKKATGGNPEPTCRI